MHLACGGLYPPRLDINNRNSVLTSKFWSPWYHFQARLRLPPTRLLQIYQSASRLVWQISLHRTLRGFEYRFGHKLGMKSKSQHTIYNASGDNNHLLHLCYCCSRTTRKGWVYKNATKYKNVRKARPPISQLPIVWPSQTRPFQACYESITSSDCTWWFILSKLRQRQFLRPSSYGCLGHAWTSDCQWYAASYWRYKYNDNLSEGLPIINDTSAKITCVVDYICDR